MLEAKGLATVEDLLGYVPVPLRRPQQHEDHRPACARRDGHRDRGSALGQAVRLQAPQPGAVRSALHRRLARHPGGQVVSRRLPGQRAGRGHEGGALRQGGIRQLRRRAHHAAPGVRNPLRRRRRRRSLPARGPRRAHLRGRLQADHARAAHLHAPHAGASSTPEEDCLPALIRQRLRMPDRAGRHPRNPLPAARYRPAPAEQLPLAGAVPPDLRGIFLAGMRRGAEARQGAHAARHRASSSTTACARR